VDSTVWHLHILGAWIQELGQDGSEYEGALVHRVVTILRERQASWQRIGGESPVAASKAADLGGEKPLPSIARFRTASISDARGGDKPRCART